MTSVGSAKSTAFESKTRERWGSCFHKRKSTTMPVLQDGQRHKEKPAEYLIELFMLKTFTSQREFGVLVDGFLRLYGNVTEIKSRNPSFIIDLGLSSITFDDAKCMCITTDKNVYRFKVQKRDIFNAFITSLQDHYLFRQDRLIYGTEKKLKHRRKRKKRDSFLKIITDNDDDERSISSETEKNLSLMRELYKEFQQKFKELEQIKILADKQFQLYRLDEKSKYMGSEIKLRAEYHKLSREIYTCVGKLLKTFIEDYTETRSLKSLKEKIIDPERYREESVTTENTENLYQNMPASPLPTSPSATGGKTPASPTAKIVEKITPTPKSVASHKILAEVKREDALKNTMANNGNKVAKELKLDGGSLYKTQNTKNTEKKIGDIKIVDKKESSLSATV